MLHCHPKVRHPECVEGSLPTRDLYPAPSGAGPRCCVASYSLRYLRSQQTRHCGGDAVVELGLGCRRRIRPQTWISRRVGGDGRGVNPAGNPSNGSPSILQLSPAWFFAATAFIYATGFLVISLFHDSYGLRALDETFLKLKYAHVGILCLAIPVVFITASYALFEFRARKREVFKKYLEANNVEQVMIYQVMRFGWIFRRFFYDTSWVLKEFRWRWLSRVGSLMGRLGHRKIKARMFIRLVKIEDAVNEGLKRRLNPMLAITLSMMATIIYIELIFAPPGEFRNLGTQIILALTVLCAYFLRAIAVHYQQEDNHKAYLLWRWIQGVVLLVLACFAIIQCRNELFELCFGFQSVKIPVGLWYLFLPGLLGFQVAKIRNRVSAANIGHGKRLWLGFCAGMVGMFYFFTVVVFGYGVYHYIPAGKGGGDFSSVSLIQITLTNKDPKSELPTSLTTSNHNKELVLIEGTSASIFVANPADHGGPVNWRKGRHNRPSVVEVQRSAIGFITYTEDTYDDWQFKEAAVEMLRDSLNVKKLKLVTVVRAGSVEDNEMRKNKRIIQCEFPYEAVAFVVFKN